ncbi:MAG: hypothetical protein LBS50_08905 [Prevotellaceae bacterium]|jgi:hypothetical protein|nr:hypothetical protein [Prevotellaceae bacterium]
MKKILKIAAVTFTSLIIIVLVVVAAAVWFVFTPEKITPAIQKVLAENVTCKSNLDKVDLTFFSTFPNFSLKINNLTLENSLDGSLSDTLLNVQNCIASVNLMKFLTENEVVLNDFSLKNGKINLFIDTLGNANFNVFKTDTTKKDTAAFELPDFISVQNVDLENVSVNYLDLKNKISAKGNDFSLKFDGELTENNGNADVDFSVQNIDFELLNSKLKAQTPKIELKIKGKKAESNVLGEIYADIQSLLFVMDNEKYVDNKDVSIVLPAEIDIDAMKILLENAKIVFAQKTVTLGGEARKIDENFDLNFNFSTDFLGINDILNLLPESLQKSFSSMKFDGKTAINGRVSGIYNEISMPEIFADVYLKNGKLLLNDLKDYPMHDINGKVSAKIDLNKNAVSNLNISALSLKTKNTSAQINGKIDDLLGKMLCKINLKGDVDLLDAAPMLPKELKINGLAKMDLNGNFTIEQISNVDLKNIKLKGKISAQKLDVKYNDSIYLAVHQSIMNIELPSPHKNNRFAELAQIVINSPDLSVEMVDFLNAKLENSELKIGISDVMNEKEPFALACNYSASVLNAKMDTIFAQINAPNGNFIMFPSKENTGYDISLNGTQLAVNQGKTTELTVEKIILDGGATYNEKEKNVLLQWNPKITAKLSNADFKTKNLKAKTSIPLIDFDFSPEKFTINKSKIVIDNSDFNLSGVITNIDKYLNNSGLLMANVDFTSDKTNIKELMSVFSGFGASDTIKNEKPQSGGSEPFMVPYGVDVTVNTKVSYGIVGDTELHDVGGTLTVKDGVLVLEQMGFTCEAARMQLTAMYRSERKNHLFVGLDFHLLDIEIDKLLGIVPQIDTIVPFLKTFAGKGEFHLAAETYLKSDYSLKVSTTRGAAAFAGQKLTVIPNEYYNMLAKYLFSKKTKNVIDSLSLEMTLFRDKVELFPSLVSIDKYQVFFNGIYSYPVLMQKYDLHAELVAPLKLAVDIKGSAKDDVKTLFRFPVKTRYGNMYKPEKRTELQQQILDLKKMISDALKRNVK